jgi:UDP-N-acetylmuramoyl-tripeptide--D-alanyl-D-alanine ligase
MEAVSITNFLKAINGQAEKTIHLLQHISSICLDSRTLKPGDVFWAIRGENYDGHQFIKSALKNGASACVIEARDEVEQNQNHPLIRVAETLRALEEFAKWYRSQFSQTTIGITGSFGKTTTRELLHTVLSVRHSGIQNQKNYNNEIGVPLTILELERKHQFLIMEMGAARPGDILPLTQITSPQIGIITGIGPAHLGGFQTIEQIVQTKGDLIAGLPQDGLALIPGDSEWTKSLRDRALCRVLTFGQTSDSTYHATNIRSLNANLAFEVKGHEYRLPVTGRHYLSMSLSIIAIARELGYTPKEIQQGFNQFQPVTGRGNIVQTSSWTIIDDTYNANPASCRAACEMLAEWKTTGRRILVLGDMLELGPDADFYHRELGQLAGKKNIDVILAIGQHAKHIVAGVKNSEKADVTVKAFHEQQALIDELKNTLRPSDVILVKGSRGMRMERIIECLLKSDNRLVFAA